MLWFKKCLVLRAVCGAIFLFPLPLSAFAYGLDGLFGGRPNPNGSLNVEVPMPSEVAPDRTQSVLDHPRPDYDPLPLTFGSFRITPSVEAGEVYNSNVYSTASAISDTITTISPNVKAVSDWGRHQIALTAGGDFNFYQTRSELGTNSAVVQLDGRYDLMAQTWLAAHGGYQLQYVPRSMLENAAGSKPTSFNLYTAGATAYRSVGILQTQIDATYNRYSYAQTVKATEGFSSYNRGETTVGGKIFTVVTDNFKPYVNLVANSRIYDATASRNSHGYRADAGAMWDLGGITSLDLYTGWLTQNYSAYGIQPRNQGADFGGRLTWNVTGLTTVVLDANRSVEEAIIAGYNSFMASGGSATVTHELRRNVLLETDFTYSNDAYHGLPSRQDDILTAGTGVRYLINRNLFADAQYSWNHRSSTVEGQGYVDHLVVGKLGLQF